MQLRVGRIPFLVCAPFFHRFFTKNFQKSDLFPRFAFTDDVPSGQNLLLSEGKIHLTPGSSFNYAVNPGKFVLAPNLCTSCNLEVRSVKLFSKEPIENLGGKRIHLTAQSATSIALLKILFAERFCTLPEYVSGRPFDMDMDSAKLLIGDEALAEDFRYMSRKSAFAYAYDLGSLWQEWQRMPFVFGAWSIHKSAVENPELCDLLKIFLQELELSVAEFRADPQSALKLWMKHYPNDLAMDLLHSYYGVLDYTFTDERKQSLCKFFELAKKIGLLACMPDMEYFDCKN